MINRISQSLSNHIVSSSNAYSTSASITKSSNSSLSSVLTLPNNSGNSPSAGIVLPPPLSQNGANNIVVFPKIRKRLELEKEYPTNFVEALKTQFSIPNLKVSIPQSPNSRSLSIMKKRVQELAVQYVGRELPLDSIKLVDQLHELILAYHTANSNNIILEARSLVGDHPEKEKMLNIAKEFLKKDWGTFSPEERLAYYDATGNTPAIRELIERLKAKIIDTAKINIPEEELKEFSTKLSAAINNSLLPENNKTNNMMLLPKENSLI